MEIFNGMYLYGGMENGHSSVPILTISVYSPGLFGPGGVCPGNIKGIAAMRGRCGGCGRWKGCRSIFLMSFRGTKSFGVEETI